MTNFTQLKFHKPSTAKAEISNTKTHSSKAETLKIWSEYVSRPRQVLRTAKQKSEHARHEGI